MKNLYLFLGEETYLLHQKVDFWKKSFNSKHGEYNLSVIDGLKQSANSIISECETMPFLGEKRLVIIENLPPSMGSKIDDKKVASLLRFLEDIPETSVIVFVNPKPDKRTKLYKKLLKIAEVDNFKLIQKDVLTKWVLQEIKQRGGKILPTATQHLIEKTGNNLWALHNEIDKLIAYAGEKSISENDIDHLVTPVYDVNVFKLTDYIGSKKTKLAIDMLDKLMESGNSSIQIFNMIIRQFRIFLQIEEMQNKPSAEIATSLKLHPFVVQNSLKQVRSFKKSELVKAYKELLEIDKKLKTSVIKISVNNENMFMLELEKFILGLVE
jgi:DNA polymerase-3 subunit delta